MRPKCPLFVERLLSLCQFSLLHRHQSHCLPTMIPRQVKLVTSSNLSPPSVMVIVLTAALFLRTLLLPLWVFRPRRAELSATVLVFSCICRWVWGRRARSSAKSRSSGWVQGVHCIPFPLWAVDFSNTQSMTSRNRKGDSRHPCHTPVFA